MKQPPSGPQRRAQLRLSLACALIVIAGLVDLFRTHGWLRLVDALGTLAFLLVGVLLWLGRISPRRPAGELVSTPNDARPPAPQGLVYLVAAVAGVTAFLIISIANIEGPVLLALWIGCAVVLYEIAHMVLHRKYKFESWRTLLGLSERRGSH